MIKQVHRNNFISAPQLRRLFKTPSVQYLFVAQNAPHRAIVVSNRSGDYQLHAVDFEGGFHRQVTRRKGGALFGSISPDGRYIYWLNDQAGEEYGHFIKISFSGGKSINITPGLKPYFSYSISSSDDEKIVCFTAAIENKNKVFGIKAKNDKIYEPFEIYSSDSTLTEAVCSPDGEYVCVAETNARTKQSPLLLLSAKGDGIIARSRQFDGAMPLSFSRKSKEPVILALVRTNNWLRPLLYNFAKKRVSEIRHRDFKGDIWALRWDEDQGEMILCDVYKAQQKLYRYNTRTSKLERIGPRTGTFNFHFNSAVRLNDGSLVLKWHNFNTSPRLIRIDTPRYKQWKEIAQWSGDTNTHYEVKNVSTHSSDGESVQMWVVRPKIKSRKLPFIIDIHGGPHGVSGDEFSPEAQAWLASGFGYCAVNYRGSIGFGKKFERKIYGNPAHWEVEDVVAARNWLVQNEYADPNNIILYGWSWGGYVALLALGKYPALWSRAIAGAAIADCVMQYEDEPAYFKAQDQERFGGTPETARARYVRSSPITYVDNIQVPILLLHGENDVRCPPRQIKCFVSRLKKLNKAISIEWFMSGHTGEFTDTSLRIRLMDKVLRFATTGKKMPPKNLDVS